MSTGLKRQLLLFTDILTKGNSASLAEEEIIRLKFLVTNLANERVFHTISRYSGHDFSFLSRKEWNSELWSANEKYKIKILLLPGWETTKPGRIGSFTGQFAAKEKNTRLFTDPTLYFLTKLKNFPLQLGLSEYPFPVLTDN